MAKGKICEVYGCKNKAAIQVEVINLYNKKSLKWVCNKHYKMMRKYGEAVFKLNGKDW